MRRDHDNDDSRIYRQNLFQPDEPILARRFTGTEVHVKQHHVKVVLGQQAGNFIRVFAGRNLAKFSTQQQSTGYQDVLIVIDDQNSALFHWIRVRIVFEIVHLLSAGVQFWFSPKQQY
jgi:hypothetical protein